MSPGQSAHVRLWSKIALPDPVTGCMYWIGDLNDAGYGRFYPQWRRPARAHRVVWTITNGEIPEGLQVDHDCHNRDLSCKGGATCLHRRCCNPSHLRLLTRLENLRASPNHRSKRTHCAKGHPFDEANTYIYPRSGSRGCRACNIQHRLDRASKLPPRKPPSSPYRGVSWERSRSKWQVKIRINGRTKNLGRYEDETEAALAYDRGALAVLGQSAELNFPDLAVSS